MTISKLNIQATLEVILKMLVYFKGLPSRKHEKEYKAFLKPYSNLKHRIKLLVNDVYGYLIRNAGFECGFTAGVQKEKEEHLKVHGKELKRAKKWIFEHGLPWDVLFPMLVMANIKSTEELMKFLKDTFSGCYVTKEENEQLNKKYRKSMPEGWKVWQERYEKAGVNIYQQPKIN